MRSEISSGGTRSTVRRRDKAHRSPPNPASVDLSVLGRIAAGAPIVAEQEVEDVFTLPRRLVGEGELFSLEARGDSMTGASILPGVCRPNVRRVGLRVVDDGQEREPIAHHWASSARSGHRPLAVGWLISGEGSR
ncbi:LexA family protein [Kitasatospora sp. NPDC057015]|uniref:LexA family protein n=1 Tax=Kitasatospora sp. NPDC057015 TaxID=3346001 RepID=UPI00362BB5EC